MLAIFNGEGKSRCDAPRNGLRERRSGPLAPFFIRIIYRSIQRDHKLRADVLPLRQARNRVPN